MQSRTATFLVLAGFCTHTAMAQIDRNAESDTTPPAEAETIEEVTVIGQRTLTSIRMQIDRASERIFELYNELNTDDLYDIHCRSAAPTGSHITRKVCSPVYFELAEADATQVSLGGGVGTGLFYGRLAQHNPIMEQKWKDVVNNNPEIVEAIVEHFELTEELKESRKAYFGTSE